MRHGIITGYSRGCRCLDCTTAGQEHRRRGLPDGDPRHGTTNGYSNWGCRCDACRAANLAAYRKAQADRRARGLEPGDPRHGTSNGYGNWGCRCRPCTDAWVRDKATTDRRYRERQAAQ